MALSNQGGLHPHSDPGFTATILAIEAIIDRMGPKKRQRALWRMESAGDRMVVEAVGKSNIYSIGDRKLGRSHDDIDAARAELRDAGEYLRQAVWFIRDHRCGPPV